MRAVWFAPVAILALGCSSSSGAPAGPGAAGGGQAGAAGSAADIDAAGGVGGASGNDGGPGAVGSGGSPGSGGAPVQSDASAPEAGSSCLMAGTDCTATPDACCSDSTCVGTSSTAICRAICHTGAECNSGCCAPLNNAAISVCSDPSLCPSPGGHCPDLVVAANDGTYLGDAMSNAYAANGVCNQYSLYGSNYGVDSIHNPNGLYGSSYSVTSAYNPYTTTPPVLFCKSSKAVLGPVTKNATLVGAVDPDSLCSTLAGAGY